VLGGPAAFPARAVQPISDRGGFVLGYVVGVVRVEELTCSFMCLGRVDAAVQRADVATVLVELLGEGLFALAHFGALEPSDRLVAIGAAALGLSWFEIHKVPQRR
jgi:hypothetical protein